MPYAKPYINLQEHEAERRRKLKQRASAVSESSKRSKGRQLSKAEFRSEFLKLPKETQEELKRLGWNPFEDTSNKIIRRQTGSLRVKK